MFVIPSNHNTHTKANHHKGNQIQETHNPHSQIRSTKSVPPSASITNLQTQFLILYWVVFKYLRYWYSHRFQTKGCTEVLKKTWFIDPYPTTWSFLRKKNILHKAYQSQRSTCKAHYISLKPWKIEQVLWPVPVTPPLCMFRFNYQFSVDICPFCAQWRKITYFLWI